MSGNGVFIGGGPTGYSSDDNIAPIWTVPYEDNKSLLEWEKKAFRSLIDLSRDRIQLGQSNLARYQGFYGSAPTLKNAGAIQDTSETVDASRRLNIVTANHGQDLVEQKVANQLKYKPNTEVVPDALELNDKQNAQAVKKCLDSNNYWSGFPKQYHKVLRAAILCGQGWVQFFWNPDIGAPKKKKKTVRVERVDDSVAEYQVTEKAGEVDFRIVRDSDMFIIPSWNGEVRDIPGLCRRYVAHISELKARYPSKASEIEVQTDFNYDYELPNHPDGLPDGYVIVREYYFKSNNILENGLYFSVIDSTVLDEPTDLDIPRNGLEQDCMGNLPFARLTDADIEGEENGYPSFAFIARLLWIYDKWLTLGHKNIFLFAHPKWVYPFGSVSGGSLANGSFQLPYRGATAPQLMIGQLLTQDFMKFGEMVLTNAEKVMRIYGVSRGSPPPGTRAAASLYFYDEQEETANSVFRRKFEDFVVRCEVVKLGLMSKYYRNDKTRMIQILGKNNQWLSDSIDTSIFGKQRTVRIKSASNLPESKYARIQALLELAEQFPDTVTKEHVMEMLEFGQSEAFLDYGMVAAMSAEGENEKLMSGEDIAPAVNAELHMVHWKTHMKLANNPAFKTQPFETRKAVEDHIGTHEILMLDEGSKNPLYHQLIQTLPQFPVYAPLPPPEMSPPGLMPQGGAMPGGAPNTSMSGGQKGIQGLAESLAAGDNNIKPGPGEIQNGNNSGGGM